MKNKRVLYYIGSFFLTIISTIYLFNPDKYWTGVSVIVEKNYPLNVRLQALEGETKKYCYNFIQNFGSYFLEIQDTTVYWIDGAIFQNDIQRKLVLTRFFNAINYSEPKVVGVMGLTEEEVSLLGIFNKTIVVGVFDPNNTVGGNIYNAQYAVNDFEKSPPVYPYHNPYIVERYYDNKKVMDFGITIGAAYKGVKPNQIGEQYDLYESMRLANSIVKIKKKYDISHFYTLLEIQGGNDTIISIENRSRGKIISVKMDSLMADGKLKTIFSLSRTKSVYPEFREEIFGNRFKGKIVVLNFDEKNHSNVAQYYCDIISNYLGNQYFIDNYSSPLILYFILLIGVIALYYFTRTSYAAIISLLIIFMIALLTPILYYKANVFINTVLSIMPVIIVSIVLLPYEIIHERVKIVHEKNILETELASARRVQTKLLPIENPIIAGFDIYGKTIPAYEVGGDFYDYLWMNQEKTKLGIVVADVSGKAMGAAMTAVLTSGMVYREIGNNRSPKQILTGVNYPLYLKTEKNIFTAMAFVELDILAKQLKLSNAGQVYPILVRNKKVEFLKTKGMRLPLGSMQDTSYLEEIYQLQSGDILLLYTDGISEAMDKQKELFGFERLETLLNNIEINSTSQQISEKIFDETRKFMKSTLQHDDMTVVVVKVI